MPDAKRPLKVFLCHAHADRDAVRAIYIRLTTLAPGASAGEDGVDAWLDKAKPCGERSRTILPGQDWELEIRKAVREKV
jgi:hypothetical protein